MKTTAHTATAPESVVDPPRTATTQRWCTHHYCRCMRAVELSEMGYYLAAQAVHGEWVRCRK